MVQTILPVCWTSFQYACFLTSANDKGTCGLGSISGELAVVTVMALGHSLTLIILITHPLTFIRLFLTSHFLYTLCLHSQRPLSSILARLFFTRSFDRPTLRGPPSPYVSILSADARCLTLFSSLYQLGPHRSTTHIHDYLTNGSF